MMLQYIYDEWRNNNWFRRQVVEKGSDVLLSYLFDGIWRSWFVAEDLDGGNFQEPSGILKHY